MRTKTLLMTAAALLAVGIVSSRADGPVYSQNVVGYANVVTPSSSANYMLTVPFTIGQSNGANEIWPVVGGQPTLPDSSTILIWDPNANNFTAYISDSGNGSTGWDNAEYYPTNAPVLAPGMGFFLNPGNATTNVFAGTVAVAVGATNGMSLPSSSANYLIGCVVPYAGSVTNGNNGTPNYAGGPNMTLAGGFPDSTTLLVWDPNANNFTAYISDSGNGSTGWDNADYYSTNAPSITVGQGFFLNPGTGFIWQVGL